jgi:hypothetical protein
VVARGRRPKPAHLRLIDGSRSTTRHGSAAELRAKVDEEIASFGKLQRPKGLKGRVLKAWIEWIEPAAWLDGSRGAAARAFVELYAEFEERPRVFVAAKHNQMRAYMSELGLTDERRRGAGRDDAPKDPYFED